MRGMRENIWQVFLFLISVSVMVTGIVFYVKKSPKSAYQQAHETHGDLTAEKGSGIPAHSADMATAEIEEDKEYAKVLSEEESERKKEEIENEGHNDSKAHLASKASSKGLHHSKGSSHGVDGDAEESAERAHDLLEGVRKLSDHLGTHTTSGNLCSSVEFLGDGQKGAPVSSEEWKEFIDAFHLAKKNLQTWLEKHHSYMTSKTFAFMSSQLEKVKAVRPPSVDEPDLNWRGIGVFARDEQGMPMIQLTRGFLKLLKSDLTLGQFELTRLVAQSWAPCDMQTLGIDSPWKPLLKCLEIPDDATCGANGYSEAGWAVSSVVAMGVAPLQCQLPALSQPQKGGCLLK